MESKRVTAVGRRGTKKDTIKNANKYGSKRKNNEDANVLRTRSGRTRTATSFNNVTAPRKKTTSSSLSKTTSIDSATSKANKDTSSAMKKQEDDGEGNILLLTENDTVS